MPKHPAVPGALDYIPGDETETSMDFQILFVSYSESTAVAQQKHASFFVLTTSTQRGDPC